MSTPRAQLLSSPATVFFSVSSYFVFFLSLGFSSFPLQTHLRHTLPVQTASLLAGLIPIAACGTYFLARLAEARGLLRYPQRAQLAAAIGVALMQGVLGLVLASVAAGRVFFSPVVDVGLCLLALGCVQSCMITLLNHNAVASLGSLAYTARAAGSVGYMIAVLFMGATGDRVLNIEAQHLYAGSLISVGTCLLALIGCFFLRPIVTEALTVPHQNHDRPNEPAAAGKKWFGLVVVVYLVAIAEMSFGMYSHEFLTSRLGSFGYYQFALGIALEIAILVAIPFFPGLRRSLLVVGPVGWLVLFSGCLLGIYANPWFVLASLAFCLNCPFQISANENAIRMKPSVSGIASLTLAQSLGYVTAACLSSWFASNLASLEMLFGLSSLTMPTPLWLLFLPLGGAALVISLRIVLSVNVADAEAARTDSSLDVGDLRHASSMPWSGVIASSEESPNDFKGDFRANNPSTHTEDIHIVVLNALPGRVGIVTEASPDSREFVGSYTDSNSGPADQYPAIDLPFENFQCDSLSKVREIA